MECSKLHRLLINPDPYSSYSSLLTLILLKVSNVPKTDPPTHGMNLASTPDLTMGKDSGISFSNVSLNPALSVVPPDRTMSVESRVFHSKNDNDFLIDV